MEGALGRQRSAGEVVTIIGELLAWGEGRGLTDDAVALDDKDVAKAVRSSQVKLTLFDGTGVGLQDLAVAAVAARVAAERGLATRAAL